MEKNCSNCKVAQGNEWHELCSKCTVNSEEGTDDNYQPLDLTYTRDEVMELMKMSSDVKHWELELANKEILDNFDKLKNQKK